MNMNEQFLDERLRRLPKRIDPPTDLWPRIEAGLGARRRGGLLRSLAIAATVVLGAAVSLWLGSGLERDDLSGTQAATYPIPNGGLTYANNVDIQYSGALKTVVSHIGEPAYSQEVAQLQLGLRTLQHATEEIRAALEENPDALYLAELLENAHRKRISMLKDLALAGAGPTDEWRI